MTLFGHITNGFVVIPPPLNEAAALDKTRGWLGVYSLSKLSWPENNLNIF